MKTKLLEVSTPPCHKLPGILATAIRTLRVGLPICLAMSSTAVFAVNALWQPMPSARPALDNDWNLDNNWTPATAPVNPGDTARFGTSQLTSPTLSGSVTVDSITFLPGASLFTIDTNGEALAISGAGIVNNSGQIQSIVNNPVGGRLGTTVFEGISSAGNATIINNGATTPMVLGGVTAFINTSNAAHATITNNGATVLGAVGGVALFGGATAPVTGGIVSSGQDAPSAGSATIINNGGTNGGSGGTTLFFAHADGGTARAITNGSGIFGGNFDIGHLNSDGMGIGSIEGSGNYFLGSKTLTVGSNNLSTTVSGIIQDGGFLPAILGPTGVGGSITKIGTGTLTLTGINTYTGTTTVTGGSLIVDGSIASAQTLVNPGGLLGGRGSIGSLNGNLVNSGIVKPGDSPGTLTVNGNYSQTATGTLRIEVASVTEHGLLAVGGHASLGGTLQLIGLGGFTLHVGDQLTFLTAIGGVNGTFGTVQNEISTGTVVQAQVVTLPNAVLLEGTQGSFVQAACNPNSAAVAQALDSAVGNPRASALIAFLNEQAFNNLCGDFTLIAPEALASIFDAGVSFANVQTANLKRRLEDVRAGDNGFNSSGFSLNGGTSNFSPGLAGVTGPEGKSGPSVMAPTPENRWGIWVTGIGEFANVSTTNQAAGFDIQTGGVTFGVDYRVCSIFAIGLTAGYANMNADLPNGGSLDVNSGQFGLYATLFGKGFYADAAITGGPSGYDSRRTALLGSANGNTGGANFNVLAAVGYDWTKGGLSVGPTANFQYTYVGISGFTESGSIAPLNIDSQNVESERTAIGMKASYEWKVGHVIIKPEISAAWQHEFGDQSYTIVSSFANGAGNSFTVSSPSIGRDSLLIGAGTAVLLNDRLSIYAYYDGELLRTNYQSNDVSAGVRLTF
jgi:outer membrane autotransporter protein